MNIEHHTQLTSGELSFLWGSYISDSMSVCMFTYLIQHIEDQNIKTLVENTLNYSQQSMTAVKGIFESEEIQVPHGFTADDVNLKAKRLFSDNFCLYYVKNMLSLGLTSLSTSLAYMFRKDISSFVSNNLTKTIDLNNKTSQILLEKGLPVRSPFVPYPTEIEFVHKQSFILEMLGKRPLIATEVTNLYANSMTNNVGSIIAASFAQVAEAKEVREYISRGADIAIKHIKVFSSYLTNHELPISIPLSASQDLTESTESPFSDKLIMYHFGFMSIAGAGNYGVSISTSMRSDLVVDYSRLLAEIIKYSEDGQNIMIKNGWFERPPLATYREKN